MTDERKKTPQLRLDGLLNQREVTQLTRLSKGSLYRLMQAGVFPRPVRLSVNRVAWRTRDVIAWINSLPEANGGSSRLAESGGKHVG